MPFTPQRVPWIASRPPGMNDPRLLASACPNGGILRQPLIQKPKSKSRPAVLLRGECRIMTTENPGVFQANECGASFCLQTAIARQLTYHECGTNRARPEHDEFPLGRVCPVDNGQPGTPVGSEVTAQGSPGPCPHWKSSMSRSSMGVSLPVITLHVSCHTYGSCRGHP